MRGTRRSRSNENIAAEAGAAGINAGHHHFREFAAHDRPNAVRGIVARQLTIGELTIFAGDALLNELLNDLNIPAA